MIYPCVDIQNEEVVQLVRGETKGMEINKGAAEMINYFGGNFVDFNVIDLDAAKGVGRINEDIEDLVFRYSARIGGGMRSAEQAKPYVGACCKVIVGSSAFNESGLDYEFLDDWASKIRRNNTIIALDVKNGKIAVNGRQKSLDIDPISVVSELENYCSEIQCTYVDKEGMMQGTDLALFRQIRDRTNLRLTAAGGIRNLEDVEELEKIGANSVVGMAFYTGKISIEDIMVYNQLDFVKGKGMIPTIIQNQDGEILYLESSNRESLRRTRETGDNWRYSKTQDKLMQVGATSGKVEKVTEVRTNCHKDTLLFVVEQTKPFACHEGYKTCFYSKMNDKGKFDICLEKVVDPKTIY